MTIRNLILALCAIFLAIAPPAMAAEKPGNGVSGFKNINAPGAFETDTNAINNLGVIAGDYIDKNGVQHGMILNGKKLTSVDRKNCTSKPGFTAISLYGINSKSTTVGWCMDTQTGDSDAFSYAKGKFVTISPPGAISSQAASCGPGAPGARAPRTRYGCRTRATMAPRASPACRTASRSFVSTPPPAPWVMMSRNDGLAGWSSSARAGPAPVDISMVLVTPAASSAGTGPCSFPLPEPHPRAFPSR